MRKTVRKTSKEKPKGWTEAPSRQTQTKDKIENKISHAEFALITLLSLQKRLRWASLDEIRFITVNEIKQLIPFQSALLWEETGTSGIHKITAVSSVVEPDKNAPYIQFMTSLISYILKGEEIKDTGFEVSKEGIQDKKLQEQWAEFLPKFLWIQPLNVQSEKRQGYLILTRSQSSLDGEISLMSDLADAITSAMFHRKNSQKTKNIKQQAVSAIKRKPYLYAALFVLLFLPIRLSVLAPAEIIAKEPKLIRAPIDAVIADIPVKPNQTVSIGDILVKFDTAEIEARLKVAQSSLNVTTSELRQVAQEALRDVEQRLRLVSLQGQIEKDKTDISYLTELLDRGIIKSQQNGVVVFEDAYDWLGRPVRIGEKIMLLANPQQTELEIQLASTQIMDLPDNADIKFFSNVTPDNPYHATLNFFSYRAIKTQMGVVAYRLKGTWHGENNKLRLGLKGTAKLYGARRPLIWHLLRKPLSVVRQWFGV